MRDIHFQQAHHEPNWPSHEQITAWLTAALQNLTQPVDLTVRFVDTDESATLNQEYRRKTGPTNILAFPHDPEPDQPETLCGDLVLCVPLVKEEAEAQHKSLAAHCAHLLVHGTLHLQGYDHTTEETAQLMEAKEIAILETLGFANPYEEG